MIVTVQLKDGRTVVGVDDPKYGPRAKTYANRTQAQRAADKLQAEGVSCSVSHRLSPVFYVRIEQRP